MGRSESCVMEICNLGSAKVEAGSAGGFYVRREFLVGVCLVGWLVVPATSRLVDVARFGFRRWRLVESYMCRLKVEVGKCVGR